MENKRRNQLAGPAYEREIVNKINAIGIFPEVCRTAEKHPELDRQKLDIVPIDPKLFDEFVYKIQAKSSTKAVPYMKLLDELKQHKGVPVIFHKKTKRVEGNRFLTEGTYAIFREKDFLTLIGEMTKYKKGFQELLCYFDSISDEEQPKVHKRLRKLGL